MHTSWNRYTILAAITITCLVGVVSAPLVFAADFTSGSFMARDPGFNSFGGTSTSTSFSATESGDQIANGESTSTNFVLNGGPMFFDSFTVFSQNWRWYDDEGNETPATDLAAENTAPTNIADANVIKLRLAVAELAGIGAENLKLRLQYSTSSDFSESVYDVVESWACTGSSGWCYGDGVDTDDDIIASSTLSDADPCVSSVGDGCGTHNEFGTSTSSFTHQASTTVEYEFTIEQSGASAATVYFFRAFNVVSSTSVPINTGETYPSLSTTGGALTFSIDGLPSSTATEGITTAVNTTATEVPFGSLALGTSTNAAQRLTVSTNAGQGYKIFAFQRQGLLGESSEIDPISGTNEVPVEWSSGCTTGLIGCYGYHTSKDVLEGGSTRFALNDSYAHFSTTPKEIAYSSGPATDDTTDIVYRVEVRNEQESGEYSGNIVYIIVPVF